MLVFICDWFIDVSTSTCANKRSAGLVRCISVSSKDFGPIYKLFHKLKKPHLTADENPILCLIPRTTVMSLSAPKNTRCKTHPFNMHQSRCSFFERVRKHTSCARDDKRLLQASSSGIRADVTVVLEVRQSIESRIGRNGTKHQQCNCKPVQNHRWITLICSFIGSQK